MALNTNDKRHNSRAEHLWDNRRHKTACGRVAMQTIIGIGYNSREEAEAIIAKYATEYEWDVICSRCKAAYTLTEKQAANEAKRAERKAREDAADLAWINARRAENGREPIDSIR